jgi:phosphoserine phosphatase
MDAVKTLSIRRRSTQLRTIDKQRFVSKTLSQKANWIIYGSQLDEETFACIDDYVGDDTYLVDLWRVGNYDVALIIGALTEEHKTIILELGLEFADVSSVPKLYQPGLIVMDMDSTAIQIECIDEIAKLAGVGDEVSEVTERAMQGELDFEQSLRQRVGKLENAPESILEQVRSTLPLMPGLPQMVKTLQAFGWKVAIASGGFTYFSDHLKETLNLDYAQSNQLDIVDGKLTGKVLGGVVSAQTKAEILVKLSQEYGIDIGNTVAIGDGANDLVMMEAAGLGIAYHAKPKVTAAAQTAIHSSDLNAVLCILSASIAKAKRLSW